MKHYFSYEQSPGSLNCLICVKFSSMWFFCSLVREKMKYKVKRLRVGLERCFTDLSWSLVFALQAVSDKGCVLSRTEGWCPQSLCRRDSESQWVALQGMQLSPASVTALRCCPLRQVLWCCHVLKYFECDSVALRFSVANIWEGTKGWMQPRRSSIWKC